VKYIFVFRISGIGISEEKQEKVFEQFYRVSGDMQHTFPGLGLGLFIASQIVKRARGKIWVESKEGEGATFSFSLPLQHI
jgi:signal transduction histidine kinase